MKEVFKVTQAMNNNAVFAINLKREEVILVKEGIGFKCKNKIVVASNDIQVFSPQTALEKDRTIGLAKQKLHLKFSNGLIFTLADHISFAVERYRNNENIDYLDNEEIKQFFPEIYKFSQKTVKTINKRFDVALKESEAVITSEIMHIIENDYEEKIDRKSISYSRMIVHIRYLVSSILQKDLVKNEVIKNKQLEHYPDKAQTEKIKKVRGVLGALYKMGQYQIVLGENVGVVFDFIAKNYGIKSEELQGVDQEA
ncbi:uncharacterized protein LOC116415437, partial [Apis florea]|uniref:uncharacterized protein LOC116415437 n=1 Tax=Apis florea TaxID=7463 RepID=UPI0012FF1F51